MIEDQHDKGGENEGRKKNGNFPRIVAPPCLFALTFNNRFLPQLRDLSLLFAITILN
jgi:hypothetical protein